MNHANGSSPLPPPNENPTNPTSSNYQHEQNQNQQPHSPEQNTFNPGIISFNNPIQPPEQLSSLYCSTINVHPQSMVITPSFNTNQYSQPTPSFDALVNNTPTTSIRNCPSSTNKSGQSCDSHHLQNNVTPLINENDNDFTLVNKRKKKKIKTDVVNSQTPASGSSSSGSWTSTSNSSSSINTDGSTSSTNTDSIISIKTTTNNTNQANPAPPPPTTTTHIKQIHPARQVTTNDHIRTSDRTLQPNEISQQARRFAQTRYAFPPFIVKFNKVVDEKLIIKALMEHFSSNYKCELKLAGHRLKDQQELLLFVQNRESFLMLYENDNWPTSINSLEYFKICPNHLPPQFSLILRNVPSDIDVNELLALVKIDYPDIINAFRISNKLKQPTSFIRLDIKNIDIIDELLKKKFIMVEDLRVPVNEYIAPAKVLVCSKCFQLGHFRGTCKSVLDVCRSCGEGVADLKLHKASCDKQLCCVRCKGGHEANDVRCPDIKSYRAVLTKSLLTPSSNIINNRNNHQQQQMNHFSYGYKDQDFPLLKHNHLNNLMKDNGPADASKRIDEMFIQSNKLEKNLNRLMDLNNNFIVQLQNVQHLITSHDHVIQLQQLDLNFQKEFVSQFISPICQVMVELIPLLVEQKTVNDKTILCQSLTSLCMKLGNDLSMWTTRFTENETTKNKLSMEFNLKNHQQHQNYSSNINISSLTTN